MNPAYTRLKRQSNLSDQLVSQLKELILSGDLRPGDRLPPERELAESFGVSRTVVREAVRTVLAQGLLVSEPGKGNIVAVPQLASVAEGIRLFLRLNEQSDPAEQIFEVRRVLEVEIAGLAAERISDDLLAELESSIRDMAESTDNFAQFAEYDVEFHATLARATGNEMFRILLDSVTGLMLEVRHLSLALPDVAVAALEEHERIWEQVQLRNAAGARREMESHLSLGKERMRNAVDVEHGRKAGSGLP